MYVCNSIETSVVAGCCSSRGSPVPPGFFSWAQVGPYPLTALIRQIPTVRHVLAQLPHPSANQAPQSPGTAYTHALRCSSTPWDSEAVNSNNLPWREYSRENVTVRTWPSDGLFRLPPPLHPRKASPAFRQPFGIPAFQEPTARPSPRPWSSLKGGPKR